MGRRGSVLRFVGSGDWICINNKTRIAFAVSFPVSGTTWAGFARLKGYEIKDSSQKVERIKCSIATSGDCESRNEHFELIGAKSGSTLDKLINSRCGTLPTASYYLGEDYLWEKEQALEFADCLKEETRASSLRGKKLFI